MSCAGVSRYRKLASSPDRRSMCCTPRVDDPHQTTSVTLPRHGDPCLTPGHDPGRCRAQLIWAHVVPSPAGDHRGPDRQRDPAVARLRRRGARVLRGLADRRARAARPRADRRRRRGRTASARRRDPVGLALAGASTAGLGYLVWQSRKVREPGRGRADRGHSASTTSSSSTPRRPPPSWRRRGARWSTRSARSARPTPRSTSSGTSPSGTRAPATTSTSTPRRDARRAAPRCCSRSTAAPGRSARRTSRASR